MYSPNYDMEDVGLFLQAKHGREGKMQVGDIVMLKPDAPLKVYSRGPYKIIRMGPRQIDLVSLEHVNKDVTFRWPKVYQWHIMEPPSC